MDGKYDFLVTGGPRFNKRGQLKGSVRLAGYSNEDMNGFRTQSLDDSATANILNNFDRELLRYIEHRFALFQYQQRENYNLLVFSLQGKDKNVGRGENALGAFITKSEDPIGLIESVKKDIRIKLIENSSNDSYLADNDNPYVSTLFGDYEISSMNPPKRPYVAYLPKNKSRCLEAFNVMRASINQESNKKKIIISGETGRSKECLIKALKLGFEEIICLSERRKEPEVKNPNEVWSKIQQTNNKESQESSLISNIPFLGD